MKIVELDNGKYAVEVRGTFMFIPYCNYLAWNDIGRMISYPSYFAQLNSVEKAQKLIEDVKEFKENNRIPQVVRSK